VGEAALVLVLISRADQDQMLGEEQQHRNLAHSVRLQLHGQPQLRHLTLRWMTWTERCCMTRMSPPLSGVEAKRMQGGGGPGRG